MLQNIRVQSPDSAIFVGRLFQLYSIKTKLPYKQLSAEEVADAFADAANSSHYFIAMAHDHSLGAIEIDGFIDKNEFKKQIDEWIHVFRNTKPAGLLLPGDPEREAEAIRSKEGIPLLKRVVVDLLDIAKKTGIPFEVK